MNREEALLLFKDSNGDYESYFEEQFFNYQQYFISKPIIRKLFEAKLTKLEQLETAYNALGFESESKTHQLNSPVFQVNVKEAFLQWEKVKSDFKLSVSNTLCYMDVADLVSHFLKIYDDYRKRWPKEIEFEGVKVSVEPNPMELFESIREFNDKGFTGFTDIKHLNQEHPLRCESKRLTLLSQMD